MSENIIKINASPTKPFFISMITRDIDLKAAILELIDNSIDGAKRLRANDGFYGLSIEINISPDKFIIKDNCGGIPIEIAEKYAFRFGRPKDANIEGSLGIFGIGMKRALFKIGRKFFIKSKTQNEYFEVVIDVDKWEKHDDWNFGFNAIERNLNNNLKDCGTTIEITDLNSGISENFGFETFKTALRTHIERSCVASGKAGIEIIFNNYKLNFEEDKIIMSDMLQPYSDKLIENNVIVRIIAGLVPKGSPQDAGWYIYCNGRLVLKADTTSLTGFGEDGLPIYHPKFAVFRGYVYFESKDPNNLPWNTTKTGIDASTKLYIAAKIKMKVALSQINDCINKINNNIVISEYEDDKNDVESHLLNKEKLISLNSEAVEKITDIHRNVYYHIPEQDEMVPYTTISYRRPKSEVEKVKKLLSVRNNAEVGIKTYEYYMEMEGE